MLGAAVWEVLAGSGSLDWVGWSLAVGAVDIVTVWEGVRFEVKVWIGVPEWLCWVLVGREGW